MKNRAHETLHTRTWWTSLMFYSVAYMHIEKCAIESKSGAHQVPLSNTRAVYRYIMRTKSARNFWFFFHPNGTTSKTTIGDRPVHSLYHQYCTQCSDAALEWNVCKLNTNGFPPVEMMRAKVSRSTTTTRYGFPYMAEMDVALESKMCLVFAVAQINGRKQHDLISRMGMGVSVCCL